MQLRTARCTTESRAGRRTSCCRRPTIRASARRSTERGERRQIAEHREQDDEVGGQSISRGYLGWGLLGECAKYRATGHQEKQGLREVGGEQQRRQGDGDPSGTIDGRDGLSTVQPPERDQVHEVDER